MLTIWKHAFSGRGPGRLTAVWPAAAVQTAWCFTFTSHPYVAAGLCAFGWVFAVPAAFYVIDGRRD